VISAINAGTVAARAPGMLSPLRGSGRGRRRGPGCCHRDRRAAHGQPDDGQDARQPNPREAGVPGPVQLVVLAYESGLVVPGGVVLTETACPSWRSRAVYCGHMSATRRRRTSVSPKIGADSADVADTPTTDRRVAEVGRTSADHGPRSDSTRSRIAAVVPGRPPLPPKNGARSTAQWSSPGKAFTALRRWHGSSGNVGYASPIVAVDNPRWRRCRPMRGP
jgi:hypothetical protein